ncbi:TetR/AcrR family transcriptional regulator [Streptomyces sp. NPDC002523]
MPRDTLTREQIVRAAIELLDAEGLEGLNMRSLGKRLDSAATAVYWHVKNKDNLVILASNEVWNEVGLPDLDTVDWRTAATTMATDLYRMVTAHPWLVMAFASQPLYGENKARHDDHSLAVFEKAGFVGAEADQAAAAVFTFVLGHALGLSATVSVNRRLTNAGRNAQETIREAMTQATEIAMRFPHLRERVGSFAAGDYGAAPEHSFEFGLQAILDGIEHRLDARSLPLPDRTGGPGQRPSVNSRR